MTAPPQTPPTPAAVAWHDAEFGGYARDLPLWERLATEYPGPLLDLGAGTGRVAIHLGARGHRVVAVDSDQRLLDALRERAAAGSLEIDAIECDLRELALAETFELIIAPMQLLHILGGEPGRRRAWSALVGHLAPGGLLAVAVLAEPLPPSGRPDPLPDVREVGGWVHSSMPLEVRVFADAVELVRLRQLVSPAGELSEELDTIRLDRLPPATLEREALDAGLRIRSMEPIAETDEHVGSLAVLLEHDHV